METILRGFGSVFECDVCLVMVEIEEVPVQILYGERLQFLVRRIDIFSEHPVNGRFERRLPLPKEYRHITA